MEKLKKITAEELVSNGVVSAPDRLTGKPEENKKVFDRLVADVIAPKLNAVIDLENTLVEQEEERSTAEQGRKTAETGRMEAENKREENEAARSDAERGRVETERARKEAETARAAAEEKRAKAELERETAERTRADETAGIVARSTQAMKQAQAAAERAQAISGGDFATRPELNEVRKIADDAVEVTKFHSNPQLLDNWYWGDLDSIIDQRGGYVVPPDTPYYSNTELTTQAGKVTAYTTATNVNGTYGTITVGSTTYYVDWTKAVRGYVGNGYTIDRWRATLSSTVTLITPSGIKVIGTNDGSHSHQTSLENPSKYIGKEVTLSALILENDSDAELQLSIWYGAASNNQTAHGIPTKKYPAGTTGLISISGVLMDMGAYKSINPGVRVTGGTAGYAVAAMKLELGDKQTLARQDENGNWVLIDPPPNKQQELAKCQRYQTVYEGYSFLGFGIIEQNHICQFAVPTPSTMRLGTVSVSAPNGIKFFDAKTGYDGTIFESHASCNAGSAKMAASFPDAPVSTGGDVWLDSGQKLILDANL